MSDELGKSLQHSVNQKFGSGTYQVLQPIKRGADGYVYKIQFIKEKRLGALKVLPRHNLSIQTSSQDPSSKKKYKADSALDQKAENQIKIHQSLRSNYVVKLYNSCKDDMNFYLFLELVSKGDLGDEISKFQHGLSIERIRKIGLNLAKGIDTIHKKGIVHRDIKPQNILLTDEDQTKICDFSCAKIINQDQGQLLKGVVGTREYMAPQIMGKYGNSVDVWSFGCVLFALATGHPPFQISKSMINGYISEVNEKSIRKLNQSLNEQMLRIHRQKSHMNQNSSSKRMKNKGEIKCECSEQSHLQCYKKLAYLLKKVLIFNVNERLSIQQVISHPFFTGSAMLIEQQQQSQMNSQQTDRQKHLQTLQSKQSKYERTHISRPYSLQSMKKVLNYVNSHDQKQQKKETKVSSKTTMMAIEKHRNKYEIGYGTTSDNIVTGNNSNLYKKQNPNNIAQQNKKIKSKYNENNENTNTLNNTQQMNNNKSKQTQTQAQTQAQIQKQRQKQAKTINAEDLIKHKLNNKSYLRDEQGQIKINKYISDEIPKPIQSGQLSSQYASRQIPIALNCQNMSYQIQLASELVTIDQNGFKAQFFKSDKVMMISPKGKHISLSYSGKIKHYQLDRLPQKYMGHYEDYRHMVDKLKQSRSRKQLRDAYNYQNQRQEQNGTRPCKTSRQKQLKQSTKRTNQRPLSLKKPQSQKQADYETQSKNRKQIKAQIEQNIDLKMPIDTSKGLKLSETVYNIQLINKISLKAEHPNKVQIILQHCSDSKSSMSPVSKKCIDTNMVSVQRLRNILIQLVVCVVSEAASNQIQGLGKKIYQLNKTEIEEWVQSSNKYLGWLSQFAKMEQSQAQKKQQQRPNLQKNSEYSHEQNKKKQRTGYLVEKQKLYENRMNRHDQIIGTNNKNVDHRIVLDNYNYNYNYVSKYR